MTTTEPHPALAHRCPFCHADPAEPCRAHRGNGATLDTLHSRRIALVDTWKTRLEPKQPKQALCCECGQVRTVSANYNFSYSDTNRNKGYGHFADERGWRETGTLKCSICGLKTRHALIRTDGHRDYTERVQRYALGGEWDDKYAPDQERVRAEYFAQLPRNPYLRHRYWTKEAEKAWDDGTKMVTALCGADMELKVDPRRPAKYRKETPGRIVADQLSDTEYEDPATGMWWIDMACVDCCRVSNAHHWKGRRTRLEWFLAKFAVHPEWVEDHEVDALLDQLEAMHERAKDGFPKPSSS